MLGGMEEVEEEGREGDIAIAGEAEGGEREAAEPLDLGGGEGEGRGAEGEEGGGGGGAMAAPTASDPTRRVSPQIAHPTITYPIAG